MATTQNRVPYMNLTQDLTIAQTATMLQVSTRTIHRWIKSGLLHSYRVGHRGIRIRPDEIERIKIEIPAN